MEQKTVLFIEDESSLQKTFGDILEQEGIKLISALDGESGIRLAREKMPDLILLDLLMPGLNGLEVLEQIKEDEQIKNIPVIVLTNSEDMKHIQEAIDLGATTYLVKINYNLQEVVEKVKNSFVT